jgi:chain length determinant protein EpsF
MSLSELIRILWVHRKTTLNSVVGMLVIAVAVSVFVPKRYRGEAAVVVDIRGSDPLAQDGKTAPVQPPSNYVATQVDVIASHNVALKVVDRLKLASDPAFITEFQDATPEDTPGSAIRDWGADLLLKHLSARPSRDSNVIYLQFTSKNAETAANVANAFAEAYLQTSLELNVDPARHQAGWFDQQLSDLRAALENAQKKVSAYEVQHGVIGTDDNRLDVETARLTEISNHLVAAQAAMYEAESRQRQLKDAMAKSGPDAAVDVLNNPLLQNLKTELARSEARFANAAQRYDRNHPQYLSALAERDSLRNKVATEVEHANAAVDKEARIARQSATDLQHTLEQQRTRILGLQHNQDEYSVLKRDVENARQAYDSALGRGSQTQLESKLDRTNIAILNRAFPPTRAAWPRLILDCALAVILGLLLGAGVSLARERLDRRVRSRDDLLQGANIAVLAELPRADTPPRRRRTRRRVRLHHENPRTESA